MSDEASVMLGHLVGLNCLDANLCMKEYDLDNMVRLQLLFLALVLDKMFHHCTGFCFIKFAAKAILSILRVHMWAMRTTPAMPPMFFGR